MAKWFGCFKMSPLERVKADIQEYRNIKDNLVYNETVLSSLYENLIIKYDEDYEDLLTEVDSCIKHKYVFDEKTGR